MSLGHSSETLGEFSKFLRDQATTTLRALFFYGGALRNLVLEQTELLLRTAGLAARLLLESGAETYRAEETVSFICQPYVSEPVQVLALPTGVFFSLTPPDGSASRSQVVRVTSRATDLSRIAAVNDISRGITAGTLSLAEGYEKLEALAAAHPAHLAGDLLASALSASFFTLLFSGVTIVDFLLAALCGLTTRLLACFFEGGGPSSALYCLASGALTALISTVGSALLPCNQYAVIVGAMMPLLPGLVMANAIRDTVNGDLISGTARTAEALLKAISLAAGAGIVVALSAAL